MACQHIVFTGAAEKFTGKHAKAQKQHQVDANDD